MCKIKKRYKWLVTGSSGFIGKNITKFLISENQNVIGIDTKFDIENYNFYNLNKKNSKNFVFYKNDLSNFNFCKKITRDVDYVLHQAAKSAIDECEKKPSSAYKSNILSFLNILKAYLFLLHYRKILTLLINNEHRTQLGLDPLLQLAELYARHLQQEKDYHIVEVQLQNFLKGQ